MNSPYSCVLIVDDDETSIFLSEIILERNRFASEIHSSANGEQAIQFLLDHCSEIASSITGCPEVILLDINMPVMDGFEFLEVFTTNAAISNSSKVVILTSSNNPRDIEMAHKFGINTFINKPLTDDKILQIRDMLQN